MHVYIHTYIHTYLPLARGEHLVALDVEIPVGVRSHRNNIAEAQNTLRVRLVSNHTERSCEGVSGLSRFEMADSKLLPRTGPLSGILGLSEKIVAAVRLQEALVAHAFERDETFDGRQLAT